MNLFELEHLCRMLVVLLLQERLAGVEHLPQLLHFAHAVGKSMLLRSDLCLRPTTTIGRLT